MFESRQDPMQTPLSLLPRVSVFYSPPKLAENMSKLDSSTILLNSLFLRSPYQRTQPGCRGSGSPGKAMLWPSVTSTLSVLYCSFFNSSSVELITKWGLMIFNPQVPSGASEKDWAHINNFPIFGNSAFCNPVSLLTISHFIYIQIPDKGVRVPLSLLVISSSQGYILSERCLVY